MEQQTIDAVDKMQAYIKAHIEEDIRMADLAKAAGYSQRHCRRIFTEVVGKSITQYIRLIRLTGAAKKLANSKERVLDVALASNFSSHEGFTKAFSSAFGVVPSAYREKRPPVRYFIAYPARYRYLFSKGVYTMEAQEKDIAVCTVSIIERPKRKLIYLPCRQGADYWSFCQEMGCAWEGLLNSIQEKFDTAAILQIPKQWPGVGYTNCAAGIEVPCDYMGELPPDYKIKELSAGYLAYFQSAPYENEDDFCTMINQVYKARAQYDIRHSGYTYDNETPLSFNFGATAETGAKIAFSVLKIK